MTVRTARRAIGGAILALLAVDAAARDEPRRQPPPAARADSRPDFAQVLKDTLTGRQFEQASGESEPASRSLFERLARGDYNLPTLAPVPDIARLDRVVLELCPKIKPPSQVIKDSTPFLMTGEFEPRSTGVSIGGISQGQLELAAGRFLVYTVTLRGAKAAPAPIVEARAIESQQCRAAGDALSLATGTTTDVTITGQGLAVIRGQPVWVVTVRTKAGQAGITLQPLDRRIKGYQVGDGWKFLSAR